MRFVKVLALVALFFFSMVFFVQNNQVLSETMSLQFNLFFKTWHSVPLPFYLLLLLAFVFGAVLCMFYLVAEKVRLQGQLRQCKGQLDRLEQEVTSLRNLPLEEGKGLPAPEAFSGSDNDDSLSAG